MQILSLPSGNVASGTNHPTGLGLTLVGQAFEHYRAALASLKASPSGMSDPGGQSDISENTTELTPG